MRKPARSGLLPLTLFVAFWCAWADSALADVELALTGGERLLVDRLGPETDSRHVVLRMESDRIVMTRRVAWRRVIWLRIGHQTFSREVLQQFFANENQSRVQSRECRATFRPSTLDSRLWTQSACGYPILPIDAKVIGVREDPLSAYRNSLGRHFPHGVPLSEAPFALDLLRARKADEVLVPRDVPPLPDKLVPPKPLSYIRDRRVDHTAAPIRMLSIRAFPISSHGKVDWDALAVEVSGFNTQGSLTRLRGTLRVTLWGQEQRLIRSYGERFVAKPGRISTIATWTRQADMGRGFPRRGDRIEAGTPWGRGAPYEQNPRPFRMILPLPLPLPDHDLRRAAFGELHVQLLAPGVGVFEATERNILLRHRSPLRDRKLVDTGSRFFAQESTHDSRRPSGLLSHNPSASRPNGGVLSVQP